MSKEQARKRHVPTADELAEMAIRGENVTKHYDLKSAKVRGPVDKIERVQDKNIQRVNVDFAQPMLKELDAICADLNVPRQSLIKTMLRQAMDRYFSNKKLRKT
ncbi:MAG: hypothetical protein C5B49_03710 [Bdellovibrio sp.]|nr:MAG: hypothetical protein C5B49_03710 [Bdellovibrio sp.]